MAFITVLMTMIVNISMFCPEPLHYNSDSVKPVNSRECDVFDAEMLPETSFILYYHTKKLILVSSTVDTIISICTCGFLFSS